MVAHTLLVDSRDRRDPDRTTPTSYRVDLQRTYFNVTEARLLTAEIPSSFYALEASRGSTSLRVLLPGNDTPVVDVVVPDGTYTHANVALVLQSFLPGGFSVAVHPVTRKLVIQGPSPIQIDTTAHCDPNKAFGWGLGYHLGFEPMTVLAASEVAGEPPYALVSPNVVRLQPPPYVVLSIRELDNVDELGTKHHGGTFAKIPVAPSDDGRYTLYDAGAAWGTPAVTHDPPIPRLRRLTVSFRYHDGTPVDFNGTEHSLTLAIVSRPSCRGQVGE
jgi:hypothetical protein